jgi:hypothetical protein
MVKVELKKPIRARLESSEDYGFLVGYYRNIGVRAETVAEAMEILGNFIRDGKIVWDDAVVHDFDKVDKDISSKFDKGGEQAIWYEAGRIFYPAATERN